jgi:hypothetical protein
VDGEPLRGVDVGEDPEDQPPDQGDVHCTLLILYSLARFLGKGDVATTPLAQLSTFHRVLVLCPRGESRDWCILNMRDVQVVVIEHFEFDRGGRILWVGGLERSGQGVVVQRDTVLQIDGGKVWREGLGVEPEGNIDGFLIVD